MAVNHYFQGGQGIGSDAEKRLHEEYVTPVHKVRHPHDLEDGM